MDFELAWGVHDSLGADSEYRQNLLGARDAIPKILDLFVKFDIEATWATVGFLFARSREEREHFNPIKLPAYSNPIRNPYTIRTGEGEHDDPVHYAPSLIELIAKTPGQEIASHTYSHYYCLEPGQTYDQFVDDLTAAQAIAKSHGYDLDSLIIPRHQVRHDYLSAIRRVGFKQHRTNERNALNRPVASSRAHTIVRAVRFADAYTPLTRTGTIPWDDTRPDAHGLVDIRESWFFRPHISELAFLERARLKRITAAMRSAAEQGALFHLWWHPHNFGANHQQNLGALEVVLTEYQQLRERYGFASYNMKRVGEIARRGGY